VCVPPSPDKGLMYKVGSSSSPCFILLPRRDAISINADGRALCQAMSHVARKKKNLVRGNSKTVFGEHKYCCIGSQPRRNARGVEPGQYNLNGVAKEEWDLLHGDIVPIFSPNPQQVTSLPLNFLVCIVGRIT